MRNRVFRGVSVCAVVAVAGVASASVNVRAVHLSPTAPTVDVLVNGGVAFPAISFPSATPYASLPNGTYDVDLRVTESPSTVLPFADPLALADNDYTVVAADTLANLQPLAFVDDNTIDPANARVRFIHGSPDAPTVDVRVAGGGPTLFDGVSFTESGGYQTVAPGTYDLDVTSDDGSTTFLPLTGIALEAGFVYTVFAAGFAAPPTQDHPGLSALLVADIPSPGAAAVLGLGGLAAVRRRRTG